MSGEGCSLKRIIASTDPCRQSTPENHDFAFVALRDPEQRAIGLRQMREFRCGLVEQPRRPRFADGEVDASDQGAVLTYEGDEISAGIDDGDVVGDPDAFGRSFGCLQHPLRIVQCEAGV